jgi:hypothetical protein
MASSVSESGTAANITASAQIYDKAGDLLGIWVSSASATPTIKVWSNVAATGDVIANTFTPIASTFYPLPFQFNKGLFVTISGTVDCTVSWTPR